MLATSTIYFIFTSLTGVCSLIYSQDHTAENSNADRAAIGFDLCSYAIQTSIKCNIIDGILQLRDNFITRDVIYTRPCMPVRTYTLFCVRHMYRRYFTTHMHAPTTSDSAFDFIGLGLV